MPQLPLMRPSNLPTRLATPVRSDISLIFVPEARLRGCLLSHLRFLTRHRALCANGPTGIHHGGGLLIF